MASVTYNGTGRRKTSVARVTLTPGAGRVVVNGKELDDYFGRRVLQTIAVMPFEATHTQAKFDVRVNVVGGGMAGQAGAIRHGISRALLVADENLRTPLKRAGLPHARRARQGAQEGRPQEGPQAPAVLQALARDPFVHPCCSTRLCFPHVRLRFQQARIVPGPSGILAAVGHDSVCRWPGLGVAWPAC